MSIDNPVGGNPQDPYERYRIVREQQDRDQGGKPPHKKPHLVAQILAMIKNAVESLLHLTKRDSSGEIVASPQENLFRLKTAFETLKIEDRNQDVPFLNNLSDIWHRLLEDSLQYQRSDPVYTVFQHFLEDIQTYPPEEEHSFGYYLTEYTGQQWLPFPYMDLIHRIHSEYQNHPKSSALERWTRQLNELRAMLEG